MRIGLFTDAYLPQISGVSSSTALLQDALNALGHRAVVVTPSDPDQAKEENDVFRVPSMPFISAKRLSFGMHPLMAKQLKTLRLDVIHSQTEFGMGLFARQLAKSLRIPHVHTFHTLYEDWLNDQVKSKQGSLYRRLTGWSVKRTTRRFCNKVDWVIVPTEKTRAVLLDYGVTTPIEIIPTGINLTAFRRARFDTDGAQAIRSRIGLSDSDKVLLYLGRISREKHIQELVTYLEQMVPDHPEIQFILVGDGPAKNELMKAGAAGPLAEHIHFTGPVPYQDVPKYYAAADFFLSASQSETQGLTYIEALAAGLPLLVHTDPVLEDVVVEGVNGFTFDGETAFKAHLKTLLALDRDAYRQWSEAASASSERYAVEHFAEAVAAVYAPLVHDAGMPARVSATHPDKKKVQP